MDGNLYFIVQKYMPWMRLSIFDKQRNNRVLELPYDLAVKKAKELNAQYQTDSYEILSVYEYMEMVDDPESPISEQQKRMDYFMEHSGIRKELQIEVGRQESIWENQIKIANISIKKFRSIWNADINLNDLNVFVGANDAGKSNILKALNLFFNGETDYGVPFDFDRDFTQLHELRKSHEKKEIRITITFQVPPTYQEPGKCTWTKIWNEHGVSDQGILNEKAEKHGARSRVPGALRQLKYRYVPAVKSRQYYKTLLADLYEAGAYSSDTPIVKSVMGFSENLKDYTVELKNEIKNRIGINSELTFPDKLTDIFEALIFETSVKDSGADPAKNNSIHVPLTSRGDGLQASHIPVILKYIAQEDRKSKKQGAPQVSTVWGFEEPENGLELSRAFSVADEFAEYSGGIQILTTTHSPAFYMKKDASYSNVFYVSKKPDTEETQITIHENEAFIAETMGLMKVVAPYIESTARKLEEAKAVFQTNVLTDIPTIMVEGKSDVEYLELAIKFYSEKLYALMFDQKLRIVCNQDNAGTVMLEDWATAWAYTRFHSKAYILLDKDKAGQKAYGEIDSRLKALGENYSRDMKVGYYKPTKEIKKLYSLGIQPDFEVEHLLSLDFWKQMKDRHQVQERDKDTLVNMFARLSTVDKSLLDTINESVSDEDLRETIVRYEPNENKKQRIVNSLINEEEDFQKRALFGFKDTIDELEKYFC